MAFNEDNLRAGLDTFTQPAKPRYQEAFKNYSKEINEGTTPKLAVERALTLAVKGLADKQNKLDTALAAAEEAQLPELEEPVHREPRTVTIKLPSLNRAKRKTTAHDRTTDDHTLLSKTKTFVDRFDSVFKRIVVFIGWLFLSAFIGAVFTALVNVVIFETIGDGINLLVWLVIFVIATAMAMIALRLLKQFMDRKREESHDEPTPVSSIDDLTPTRQTA
jgi:hypothetical protein